MIVSLIVVLVSWFFTDTKASNELSGSFPLKIRSRLRGKGKGLVQLQAQAISAFPLTTFAGQLNEGGLDDGILASESKLSSPGGIWSDMWGNVYFSDTLAHTIMKVENNSGVMRVVGGIAGRYGWNGDGSVSSQTLFSPTGVTGKKYEDKLIFCDTNNHVVRELSLSEGLLTTIAGQGGQHGFSGEEVFATEALLSFPISVFVDAGGDMFIAELERCTIRKVVLATGLISTIAGIAGSCGFSTGGAATTQLLNDPRSVFVDLLGSVWIVDGGNKLIRRLSLDGEFSIVSNGVNNEQLINRGNSSAFDPLSLWVDKSSNVFVSDVRGVVNLINVMNGSVSLYASLNVSQMAKRLWQPSLYPVWGEEDTLHQLFVGDSSSNRMMRVILPTATPTEIPTVVPSMSPSVVPSIDPSAVPTDFPTAVPTYVPTAVPSAVPSLDPSQIPTAAPTFSPSSTPTAQPSAIPTKSPTKTPTVNPTVAPSAAPSVIPTLIPSASPTRNPTSAPTTSPTSIPTFNPSRFPTASPTCNPSKTPTYIPSVTPTRSPSATPTISPTQAPTLLLETVLVGKMYEGGHSSGLLGVESEISSPWSMWTSPEGDIYFTDTATHTVSQFNRSTGIVKIIAGMAGKFGWNGDGKATTLTRFHAPTGLTGDARQGNLLICDTNNHVVRTVAYGSGGMVSSVQTIAGQGKQYGFVGENVAPLQAKLSFPIAVYYDSKETSPYYGNLYIAELGRCTIRMISASTGLMSTIVGIPGRCEPSSNGAALSKTLNQPHSIYGDDDGNLVIADTGNHVLRWYIMATGELTTIGGTGLVGSGPGVVNDGEIVVNGVSPLTVNLSQPFGVWLDKTNNIFISEGNGTAIRMINYYDKKIYTISDVSNSSEEIDPLVLFQNTGRGIYGEQNDEANMLFIADALRNVIFSINLPFFPTLIPTAAPTVYPSATPTALPTIIPSLNPTPTLLPTVSLTSVPTAVQLIRTSGRVYTVAGGGTLLGTSGNGGPATAAQLYVYENPSLWKDSLGTLFIAEDNNRCIRKVVNGIISTIAGICGSAGDTGDNGPATNAKIATALNLWSDGTYMYFNSNRLRKVHLSTGIITAVAGGGTVYPTSAGIPATSAKFSQSHALWGNSYALYLSDSCGMLSVRNNIIRLVLGANPDACSSTNVVGMRTYRGIPNVVTYENGTQEDRSFMYVLDFWGIFTYDLGSKTVTRIVGSKTAAGTVVNGTVVTPNIYLPSAYGMFIDSNQNIFLLEKYGISYIDAVTKIYWTLGGHGQDYSNGVTIINAKVNLAMNMFVDTNNNNDIYYIERGGLVRVVTIT